MRFTHGFRTVLDMISGGSRTLGDALRFATEMLEKTTIDGYDIEARLLTEWACDAARIDFVSQPNMLISNDKFRLLEIVLARRIAGEPVHRIMGFRDFYGLRLELGPETLEPRPDSEVLVDLALELMSNTPPKTMLDLGTGTGALALALLSVFHQATVEAAHHRPSPPAPGSRRHQPGAQVLDGTQLIKGGGQLASCG